LEGTTTPAKAVTFEVPRSGSASSEARAALRPIAPALAPRTFFDLSSVVSEVVASFLRSGGRGTVRIEVSARDGAAEGAIEDDVSQLSDPSGAASTGDAERIGRRILDLLCERWRVLEGDQGTRIEFRVLPTVW
jgi:hypothetical protein